MTCVPLLPSRPILLMMAIAICSGAIIAMRRVAPPAHDLVLWTFVESHAQAYRSIIDSFERSTGKSVSIEQLAPRAEDARLSSMFFSGGARRADTPDLVEIEIGQLAKFFRPPVDDIGFLPLDSYLAAGRWREKIISSRLSCWSKGWHIFGIPHDVHPVSLTYRKDLFDEAGIDLTTIKTWPEFQQACLNFQNYWQARGFPTRHAMELSQSSADGVAMMLLQRHIELIDESENIQINTPIVARTLAFYAQLVAGENKIGVEAADRGAGWAADVAAGNICAFLTPDWRIADLRAAAPALARKFHMVPLPKFESTDSPTSTWGGTMIGIPRACANPDQAWKLIEFLYLDPPAITSASAGTIIPPLPERWSEPQFHEADPFFDGQRIGDMYLDLARKIPSRHVTPLTPIAEIELAVVLNRAVAHVSARGVGGLEDECQRWLNLAAVDLRARARHGSFENQTAFAN